MSLLYLLARRNAGFTDVLKDLNDIIEGMEDDGKMPGRPGGRIDLGTLNSAAWLHFFRFTRSEVEQLVQALDLPDPVVCDNGVREDAVTALAMLLRRLAYPARMHEFYFTFGWEPSRFSRITRALANYIYLRWRHLLHFDAHRLHPGKLAEYVYVIHRKGAALNNCWGFVDGTLRRTARPSRNQRLLFNGWKRFHAVKFHSIVTPNGLHSHLFGPVEGRRHDKTLYRESNIARLLETHSYAPNGSPLCIYGDPAYQLSSHLVSPFMGSNLAPEEELFNNSMSGVREAVEWGFGEVVRQFAFLDFHKNQKVLLQPVGTYYAVGILLCNAHAVLHGSQVSHYFGCPPPRLTEYFHGTAAECATFLDEQGDYDDLAGIIPGVDDVDSVPQVPEGDSDAEEEGEGTGLGIL